MYPLIVQAVINSRKDENERRGHSGAAAHELLQALINPVNLVVLCILQGPLSNIATTSRTFQTRGLTVEELMRGASALHSEVMLQVASCLTTLTAASVSGAL